MQTTEKTPTTEEIIKKNFDRLKGKDDFELREQLKCYGFTTCLIARQYYKPGTEEYKELYKALFSKAGKMYDKVMEGTKDFEVDLEYRAKHGEEWFGFGTTFTERSTEEAKKRLVSKTFRNLRTDRVVLPVFKDLIIKEKK